MASTPPRPLSKFDRAKSTSAIETSRNTNDELEGELGASLFLFTL